MPTYEYLCGQCGHEFEVFQSMKDKSLAVCPKTICPQKPWGQGPVKRAISAGAGLLFKGSGFYITDYRSEGYKKAAKKESETAQSKTTTKKAKSKPGKKAAPNAAKKTNSPNA